MTRKLLDGLLNGIAQETESTPVIFRRGTDGSVFAIFPNQPADPQRHTVVTYEHIGQHGSGDYGFMIQQSRPAFTSEPDTAALTQELEQVGYRLKVYQRWTR